jgi:hypothetical protein
MGAAPISLPNHDQKWLHGVNGWGDAVTGQKYNANPALSSTWGTSWSNGGVAGGGYGGYGWGGQGMAAVEGQGLYAKSGNGQFDSYSYTGYAPAFPYGGYSYTGVAGGGALPTAARGPLAPATANVVPVNYAYGGYGGPGNNPTGEQTSTTAGSYGFPNAGIGYGYGNYQATAPGPYLGAFGGANPYNWDRSEPPEPPAWPHWGPYAGQNTAYGNPYTMPLTGAYPYAAAGFPYAAAPYAAVPPDGSFAGYGLPASNGYMGAGGMVSDGTYLTSSRITGGSNHTVR